MTAVRTPKKNRAFQEISLNLPAQLSRMSLKSRMQPCGGSSGNSGMRSDKGWHWQRNRAAALSGYGITTISGLRIGKVLNPLRLLNTRRQNWGWLSMPNEVRKCHEPEFFGIFLCCRPIKLTASDPEPVALLWRAYLVLNAELNRQRENQPI